MRHKWEFVLFLAFTAASRAQSPLSGPVEGFIFDGPTRSIRAVNGVLGSAMMGPVLLPDVEFGSIAPHSDYGIAFRRGQCLLISGLSSTQPSTSAVSGCSSMPEGVAWSSDASVAALYSRSGNWIQTIDGFPSAPVAGSPVDLSPLGGSLFSVAAGSRHVAFGMGGSVYSMIPGQSFAPLLSQVQPSALAFSADEATLYVLDASNRQITEVNLAATTSLSYGVSLLQDPVDLRASPGALYVLGRADRLLLMLDGSSHQVTASLALSFQPSGFAPLGASSAVLKLRSTSRDPLWTFTTAPQTGVYFVPAVQTLREDRRR